MSTQSQTVSPSFVVKSHNGGEAEVIASNQSQASDPKLSAVRSKLNALDEYLPSADCVHCFCLDKINAKANFITSVPFCASSDLAVLARTQYPAFTSLRCRPLRIT